MNKVIGAELRLRARLPNGMQSGAHEIAIIPINIKIPNCHTPDGTFGGQLTIEAECTFHTTNAVVTLPGPQHRMLHRGENSPPYSIPLYENPTAFIEAFRRACVGEDPEHVKS